MLKSILRGLRSPTIDYYYLFDQWVETIKNMALNHFKIVCYHEALYKTFIYKGLAI
jgi:hypothetical protein